MQTVIQLLYYIMQHLYSLVIASTVKTVPYGGLIVLLSCFIREWVLQLGWEICAKEKVG